MRWAERIRASSFSLFHEVSEPPAPSHGDLDFKFADHVYDTGRSGAPKIESHKMCEDSRRGTLQASLSVTGIYR